MIGRALARLAAAILLGPAAIGMAAPTPAGAPAEARGWRAVEVASGVHRPWSMAWLPDGRLLVTGKSGTLHQVRDGTFVPIPIAGLPPVFSDGQGALMDLAPHPDDRERPRLYMTLATGDADANRTILVRGRLVGDQVTDVRTLFEAQPAKASRVHFGSRLLWLPDGTLLMSVGDGGDSPHRSAERPPPHQAQNLATHLGAILRLTADGQPAPDNPFAGRDDARAEIWSYGHRNVQGLARDPASGWVWATEHGPRGGDELNRIERGGNYGWPLQSLGRDYRSGEPIGAPSVAGMIDPVVAWSPSPATSGLVVYTGDRFPAWRGHVFSGGLASADVRRIALDRSGQVITQDRLPIGSRVRDVRQGPDGYLYVLTDERHGRLLRIEPVAPGAQPAR